MTHNTAYEIGSDIAGFAKDAFNTVAFSEIPLINLSLSDSLSATFNFVGSGIGQLTDLTTGALGNYMPDDFAKVAAGILAMGAAGWLAKGNGAYGLAILGIAGSSLALHTSDHITPDSTVGRAIEPITDIISDIRGGNWASQLKPHDYSYS